ncbi:Decarbamoylnovobiocin carbamoyltransferase [compost metagenome]
MEKYAQYIISCSSFDPAVAVEDIIQHPIVWFNGAAEIGPRALGNRSLLADPRTERSKDILNEIKQREWWRPVAPVILEEEVKVWFQNGGPSPYMLNAFKIRDEKKPVVPAICHLDDTARVQTIQAKDNPYLAELIEAFKERTGVPILCNTSLNDKIEPIINRFEEALHFALKKRIPVMYVNGYRLEFATQLAYPGAGIAEKEIHFDINDIEVISRHLEIMHNEEWIIYYKNYYMFQDYNLAADKDRMAVKKKIRLLALASFRAGS